MRSIPAGGEKAKEWDEGAPVPRTWIHLLMAIMKALKTRNALVRECMAELLGTFVLLVREAAFKAMTGCVFTRFITIHLFHKPLHLLPPTYFIFHCYKR